jgi:hypothetical protein
MRNAGRSVFIEQRKSRPPWYQFKGWLFLICNSAHNLYTCRTFDLFGPMTPAHGCKCRTHPTGDSTHPLFFLGSIRAWGGATLRHPEAIADPMPFPRIPQGR